MRNEAALVQYLENMTLEALKIAATVQNPIQAAAAIKKIHNVLDQFGYTIEQILPAEILTDYFKGVDSATAQLVRQGVQIDPASSLTEGGLIRKPFQKVIHINAVRDLIDDTMLDMRAATRTAKFSAAQVLDSVNTDLVSGLIQGNAIDSTISQVMKTFFDEGLTAFITSDGKRLPLRFYAMTVTRTKTRAATLEGSRNRFLDAGHDLVQIQGNGDSCKVCATYNGMVVSLNGQTPGYPVVGGDIMLPPYHPNCRCAETVFIPRYASQAEIAAIQARNDAFDPEVDRRSAKDKASYEREQSLRRKANEEMKQWMRWQGALGAEAPKTLGAFRTMKHANSPKFQELQSEYRSWAMLKK